jgi:methionyl-tRNA synthetase
LIPTLMSGKPYYITTAIAYPNGVPHIGHAYELIATDAIARFMRLDGRDVFFLTGTDEHGIKMLQTAAKENITPRELVERNVPRFLAMAKALNASNDAFIRTTEPRHFRSSEAIWERMQAAGDIYLDKYAGWYSVRDEAYYDESETRLDDKSQRLGPQGTPVEWVEEESYFFKLSAFTERLLDLYKRVPDFVLPRERMNEVASFVRGGLKDLSLSRTTFDWGIKVPENPAHVMYVWVDALTNYITAVGYPDTDSAMFKKYWPADLHVIGKDIVRFHAVYWPAFLMSAGIEVPRRIFSHGFLFNRGEKMSKSVGNVVDPFALAKTYGVDPLRFFFLREVPFGQDGNYNHEAIVNRVNSDLANDLGNLAQRSLTMISRQFNGLLPKPYYFTANDARMLESTDKLLSAARSYMQHQQLHLVLNIVWSVVAEANRYFANEAPWALAKTDRRRQGTILYVTAEVLRQIAILVLPFIPTSAEKLLDQLGVPSAERTFQFLGFQRRKSIRVKLVLQIARSVQPTAVEGALKRVLRWRVMFADVHRIAPGTMISTPTPIFPRYVEPSDKAGQ